MRQFIFYHLRVFATWGLFGQIEWGSFGLSECAPLLSECAPYYCPSVSRLTSKSTLLRNSLKTAHLRFISLSRMVRKYIRKRNRPDIPKGDLWPINSMIFGDDDFMGSYATDRADPEFQRQGSDLPSIYIPDDSFTPSTSTSTLNMADSEIDEVILMIRIMLNDVLSRATKPKSKYYPSKPSDHSQRHLPEKLLESLG